MTNTYIDLNAQLNLYDGDGKLQLHKDREAAKAYFIENVNKNTQFFHDLEEKIHYLVKNEYWDGEVIDQYDYPFIKKLFKKAYEHKYRFSSFLGAYKFYNMYALRSNDNETILERFEDRVCMTALFLARGDKKLAERLMEEIITGRYQPATPTFQNAGKARGGELVSCFLLNASDSLDSIQDTWGASANLSKIGGGVAINMTNLRESGAPLKGRSGLAKGIIGWMKIYEDIFSTVDQLGTRPGAGAVYLSIHHPDIELFLDSKKENADEKIRIKTLSTGVVIPDVFIELARKGEDYYTFSPYDVLRETGETLSNIDITARYEELANNPNIRKKRLNPRKMMQNIAETQAESGYPFILYSDTANRANPVDGRINMSNLCVTGDTRLLTDSGYVPIKELHESQADFRVVVDERARLMDVNAVGVSVQESSKAFLTAEQAEVFKLTTKEGYELKATEWHKMYVLRDGEIVKIPLKEVVVGDMLLVAPYAEDTEKSATVSLYSTVESVEFYGVEDVYDVTVENGHSIIFDGIATGNCSEILQVNEPTVYDEKTGRVRKTGLDISCNLGSVNIVNMMAGDNDFGQSIETMMRALTAVSDMTSIDRVPTIKKANDEMHSVGLGQMSLASYFSKNEMMYGDEESLDFTNVYFGLVNYYSLVASNKIAVERKASFYNFDKSDYASGEYFDQFIREPALPKTAKVKKLFKDRGVEIPTAEDWMALQKKVMRTGLWHSYRQAVAPTGSISYVNGASASIHPVTSPIEIRKERLGRVYFPQPEFTEELMPYFKNAYELGYEALIDVHAVATRHVDQGISTTLFLPENATTRDYNKAQLYAWKKGLKTLYYVRIKASQLDGTQDEGCVSCAL